jgi:hypothetical protein
MELLLPLIVSFMLVFKAELGTLTSMLPLIFALTT